MRDKPSNKVHVVWIYTGSLAKAMDAATWLKTVDEIRNSGWRVTLIAVGSGGYCQICGIEVFCIPRPEIYLLRQIVFHLRVIFFIVRKLAAIDVILFHETSAPWVLPLWLSRRIMGKRRPLLVMDTRSLPMPHLDKGTWREKIRTGVYAYLEQLGTYCADGRLAITQRMAEAIHIPVEKLWGIWPSGADMEHFSLARLDRHWPLRNDPITLIYHGAMHYERNLMTLCYAVERANAEGMFFKLSLVGDGAERAELESFADQADGSIRVIRSVKHTDIPQELALAHVGVLPFPDEEKFRVSSPIKLFEYMASGMPILATRIACHTDVVGNEEYAFWADNASEQGIFDALCKIWESQDQLSEMGQRAVSAADSWTWKTSANKLRKALEAGIAKANFDSDLNNGDYF